MSASSPRSVLDRQPARAHPGQPFLSCIVLGGGVAGILAAHAACQHFGSVTLLEGDTLAIDGPPTEQNTARAARILQVLKQYAARADCSLQPALTFAASLSWPVSVHAAGEQAAEWHPADANFAWAAQRRAASDGITAARI